MLATGPRAHQPARFGPDRAGSAARRPAETRESSTWRYWYSYGEVELPDQGCVGRLSPIRRADQLLSSHARDQDDAPPHHRDDQASHRRRCTRLVGHERNFTFRVYNPLGLDLAMLREVVEAVRYPGRTLA